MSPHDAAAGYARRGNATAAPADPEPWGFAETREGMIIRAEALIAELLDQLYPLDAAA